MRIQITAKIIFVLSIIVLFYLLYVCIKYSKRWEWSDFLMVLLFGSQSILSILYIIWTNYSQLEKIDNENNLIKKQIEQYKLKNELANVSKSD